MDGGFISVDFFEELDERFVGRCSADWCDDGIREGVDDLVNGTHDGRGDEKRVVGAVLRRNG